MAVQLNSPLSLCSKFNLPIVEIFISTQKPKPSSEPSALTYLMGAAAHRETPALLSEPKSNFDRVYNDLIRYFGKQKVTWSSTTVKETGNRFAKTLRSALWYITCHHNQFAE